MVDDQLLGPFGLTVALIIGLAFVSRELLKFVREYIAELEKDLKAAMKGWQDQTEANRILADALAARNRDDEFRNRMADKS